MENNDIYFTSSDQQSQSGRRVQPPTPTPNAGTYADNAHLFTEDMTIDEVMAQANSLNIIMTTEDWYATGLVDPNDPLAHIKEEKKELTLSDKIVYGSAIAAAILIVVILKSK